MEGGVCGRQRWGRYSGFSPFWIRGCGDGMGVSVICGAAIDGVSFSFLFGAIARAVGLGRNRGRSCTLFAVLGRLGVLDWGWGRWVCASFLVGQLRGLE